jgi:hypothetical protein
MLLCLALAVNGMSVGVGNPWEFRGRYVAGRRRVNRVRQRVDLPSSLGGIGRYPVRPPLDLAEAELLVDRESHLARHQKRPPGTGS